MPLELRLLGGVSVLHAGAVTRVPLERPVSLLVHLALQVDWVGRRDVALLYRPDAPEEEALAYLRKLVFRARQHPWAAGLEVTADALRWSVTTDVARFTAAVEQHDWARAVSEYGGRFLGGAPLARAPGFAAWREAEERALEAALNEARAGLARQYEDAGRHAEAIQLNRAVLSDDPFAEASVQALLRLLSAADRRQEALGVYERFRHALEVELGAVPLEATEALADELRQPARGAKGTEIGRAASGRPAATRAAGTPGAALPTPGTPFVGRAQELSRLRTLLHEERARLVTIVGLGGSGKTRLAIEAAAGELATGREVAFVSLAAADSAEAAAGSVVEALGLPWEGNDAERSLLGGLKDRDLLLLLDNFEGVLEAAPTFGRLLTEASALTLVVTSREPLKLHGEWLLDIGGLEAPPAPPEAAAPETQGVREFDAVRLYLQQAARVMPGLNFGAADLATVGQICRKLDGLPLAIELAASWTPLLSAEEVLVEVDRDPGILVSHRRDVPQRHRSLWRVFDHTWERLEPEERAALMSLSVFPAGFGLAAARAVTGSELPTLLRLMDHKLVRRTGEGRFELHQLVKQYAGQRSQTGDLVERARRSHSRHYCAFLAGVTGDLRGNDVHAGLGAVQAELPNVLAAWNHAVTCADHEALDAARDALEHYFYYRADFGSACQLFAAAAAALGRTGTGAVAGQRKGREPSHEARRVAGRLLVHHSEHERHRGRPARSLDIANEALEQLQEVGDEADVAYAKLSLGTSLERVSAYAESESIMREVLAYARRSGDLYLQGAAHNVLGNLLSSTQGNVAGAEEHYRASLEVNRAVGNLEGVNGALINLGACRYDLNDLDGAVQLWQEAADIAVRLGHKQREAVLHNNMGSLYEAQGRLGRAEESYRLSLSLRREIDDRTGQANALHNLGRLAAATGDLETARLRLEESLRLFVRSEEPAGEAHARSSLARLLGELGHEDAARTEAHAALALALKLDSRSEILGSLLTVALLHERAGELSRASGLAAEIAAAAAGSLEPLRAKAEKLLGRTAHQLTAPEGSAIGPRPRRPTPRRTATGARPDDELRHVAKRVLSHLQE